MNIHRLAVVGSITAVVAAVAAGLWSIGSPGEQRLRRLDERRVSDLIQLSQAIYRHHNERHALPSAASDVVNGSLRGLSRLPLDPSTEEPYEYRVTGERKFELCAVFSGASRSVDANDFWYHDAGRRCYEFDVPESPSRP
jgi:hypothetical protein